MNSRDVRWIHNLRLWESHKELHQHHDECVQKPGLYDGRSCNESTEVSRFCKGYKSRRSQLQHSPHAFWMLPRDVPSGFNHTNGIGAMMAKRGPLWCHGQSLTYFFTIFHHVLPLVTMFHHFFTWDHLWKTPVPKLGMKFVTKVIKPQTWGHK